MVAPPTVHIVIDGQQTARTINRRVKVKLIVQKYLVGDLSVAEIAAHYQLDLADVHAALAYYYDNQAAIDAEIARDEELVTEVGVSAADLRERIEQRRNRSDRV